jgi:hypothetical protein
LSILVEQQSVAQAFQLAAGELGMCSAAWLFVREAAETLGEAGVSELRDRLGRDYPVLSSVAKRWLGGARGPETNPESLLAALAGVTRLVIVGVESDFLDALVPLLGATRASLLTHSSFDVDWGRVVANYGGRLDTCDLGRFQELAGRKSALLTFAYGVHGERVHVLPDWMRVSGSDVRTQFRALIAWDVLRDPMYLYPRWLVEAPAAEFSHVV